MTGPEFHSAEPPAFSLPAELSANIVILPREVDDDGIGLYSDYLIDIVKRLRALDTDAAYLHDSENRRWIGKKGFTPNELALVIAIAGAGVWDTVKMALPRLFKREQQMKIKVISYTKQPDGSVTHDSVEMEGSIDEIERAIEKIHPPEIEQ